MNYTENTKLSEIANAKAIAERTKKDIDFMINSYTLVDFVETNKKSGELELRIISSLFVKCSEFQNDICDIIKTNTIIILNLTSVPHLKRMYTANKDLMSVTLDYLVGSKRITEKEKKLIIENDSKVALAVERN